MMRGVFDYARPLINRIDAEKAHTAAIKALRIAPLPPRGKDDPSLRVEAFGLVFPNPVGLAAGFDKHAEVPDQALKLDFGFVEVGGVTPRPQPGNPRPRVFRLPKDQAVINRYGLNSQGGEVMRQRLAARDRANGIVGVNIGANKDSEDRAADYVTLVKLLAPVSDYISVNVSSPNTPGLRNLQGRAELDALLARVRDARDALPGKPAPLLLKIAPDVSETELDDIVAIARARQMDGMIVANTTIARPETLQDQEIAKEAGGLSGKPLFEASTRVLAETYRRVEGQFPLVGAGGIDNAETALAKIRAGATLVQFYSAMVFKGPGLAREIAWGLADTCRREGIGSITEFVGREAA
jgi:dihydroorotate dehydrogenase